MKRGERDLVIFTQFYPYGYYDSYLDEEIRVLAGCFGRIIVISGETEGEPTRPCPPNVIPIRFVPRTSPLMKLGSARFLLRADLYRELWNVRGRLGPRNLWAVLRHVLAALGNAEQYLSVLGRIFAEQSLDPQNTVLYSYWMLEHAYAAALFKKARPGTTVVARAHGWDLYFERSPASYLPLKKLAFEQTDALFFISERGRAYFKEAHAIPEKEAGKLRVSRLGVLGGAPPMGACGAPLRVVSNAFITPIKRIDLIARALALVHDIEIEWIHFGDVSDDSAAFEGFQREVQGILAATPSVRAVFKGRVPNRTILAFYRENPVDIFLNVSTSEGLPVSIMEAMAHGIPVIATAVGGNPEIVNESNGILLSADLDAPLLADVIHRFASLAPDARREFGRKAFETWQERFDASKNYRAFAEEVVSLTPARPRSS